MRHMYTLLLVQNSQSNMTRRTLTGGVECWSELLLVKATGPTDLFSKKFRRLNVKSERIFQSNEIFKFLYASSLLRSKFDIN